MVYSVKSNDVTVYGFEWQQSYVTPPPPYFIVLASSVEILEVNAIEFCRIQK